MIVGVHTLKWTNSATPLIGPGSGKLMWRGATGNRLFLEASSSCSWGCWVWTWASQQLYVNVWLDHIHTQVNLHLLPPFFTSHMAGGTTNFFLLRLPVEISITSVSESLPVAWSQFLLLFLPPPFTPQWVIVGLPYTALSEVTTPRRPILRSTEDLPSTLLR